MIGGVQRRLRASARLRGLSALLRVLRDALPDSRQRADRELSREFEREDPWGYDTKYGSRRFGRELELIDSVSSRRKMHVVLEVGCAEGHFTELLAPRCDSLLAVDVSSVALDRARTRCRDTPNVHFAHWDLRTDDVPGEFDLVVATSVLEYLKSPRALRVARAKLVAAVRPAGWLLIGNVRLAPAVERSRWGRLVPRGAFHVNRFVAEHPDLDVVAHTGGDDYLELLLVKR
jgi:2-polyprenyl-3-methyl-5-hydroxy-6-metoxy-1,4-benzoquinol methylase